MSRMIAVIVLGLMSCACGSESPTGGMDSGGGGAGGVTGSIRREQNQIVFDVEGAQRDNFCAQLWDKAVSGTSRIGEPVFQQCGLGNGALWVESSKFACMDLQADLGGSGGGILVAKHFEAWGECLGGPAPRPRPTPTFIPCTPDPNDEDCPEPEPTPTPCEDTPNGCGD